MNLHSIVTSAISTVNPPILCTLRVSSGYNVQANGRQTPNYQDFVNVSVQIQALSYTDLMKLDALNVQGTRRKAYLNGNIEGIDRQAIKGGDLFIMPDLQQFPGPTEWLVALVLEHWDGWSCLAITLQNPRS